VSTRSESKDPIDALIDDAARRLVAGEPSSSLRRSVLGRIGRRRSAWWSFAPALAGSALVAIAIVGRSFLDPVEDSSQKPTIARTDAERPASGVASQPAAVTLTQPERIDARQFTRRLAAALPPPPAEEESLIPPITIEPLAPVPLSAVQIAVDESSGVMPIEIAPLQIEPLLGQ